MKGHNAKRIESFERKSTGELLKIAKSNSAHANRGGT